MEVTDQTSGIGEKLLTTLLNGNKRWVEAASTVDHNIQTNKAEKLVEGQNPDTVIITCSDSRVIPEFIFDTEIGELFVIRIAGNVITTEVLASIEFAMAELDTHLVIMLGHQNCGAVQSTIAYLESNKEMELSPNIRNLVEKIKIADIGASIGDNVMENVNYQKEKMVEGSTILQDIEDDPDRTVAAAIYWMDSRKVEILEYN